MFLYFWWYIHSFFLAMPFFFYPSFSLVFFCFKGLCFPQWTLPVNKQYLANFGVLKDVNRLRASCCCCEVASVSDSVWPHRQQPTRLLCPWDSPGKNIGVGCHFLLQWKVKSCPTLNYPLDCSLKTLIMLKIWTNCIYPKLICWGSSFGLYREAMGLYI